MSCLIFVSLIVQMWKLRPQLREVRNLLTHTQQARGAIRIQPRSSVSFQRAKHCRTFLPLREASPLRSSWSLLSNGSDFMNDLGHVSGLP